MFLKEFHRFFLEELKLVYEAQEASAITYLIFESLAGIEKQTIITQPNRPVAMGLQQQLETALQRLKQMEPVQYVIGYAWFCNLRFKVSPAVLVPRPETEELVTEILKYIEKHPSQTLLDVGTGSGCIPISIKNKLPALKVTAIDVSEEALVVAKENAATLRADIYFMMINFLEEASWNNLGTFDLIVSNPPYIPEIELESLHKNVTSFEPHLALFVPDNKRFIFYEKIAAFGLEHLSASGCIFMETHEDFAKEVQSIFSDSGYDAIIKKDFFEKERMVIATRYL